MKSRTSIKTRVTAWYVSFLIIIVCILFASLGYISNRYVQDNIRTNLQSIVEYSIKDVKIKDGQLNIDRDMINEKDGISILVYQENNFIVTGTLPEDITSDIPFINQAVRIIEDGDNRFYVYDYLINDPEHPDVWVRGITSANLEDSDPAIALMTKAFIILLPTLILVAAAGGYLIARRAFRPVNQISDTVRGIQAGGDLSRRIGLPDSRGSKDEIRYLASTFDDMLDRLEESFESEKQFSNDASHELRTPLAVIMAQCEYAMSSGRSPEETQEALEVIYGQSRKMSTLISRLLMIARADRGVVKLELEEINVSELTSMVSMEHEMAAQERNIAITCDIQPDIIATVDESMFIRIWANLIGNSIKYGKEDGNILVSLSADESHITGSVKDDGIGISEEDLPKIWNRFYQVDPSRNDSGSAGLGLSIVRIIVSQHGGTITAESEPGKGTEITFKLPR